MKKALISGGTSGIGLEIVHLLSDKNFKITVLTSQNIPSTENISYIQTDFAKNPDFTKIQEHFDIVILCAGMNRWAKIPNNNIEMDNKIFHVNFLSHYKLLHHLIKLRQPPKKIALVSSTSSLCPLKDQFAYSVSKINLNLIFWTYFDYCKENGVHLMLSLPSSTATSFWGPSVDKTKFLSPKKVAAQLLKDLHRNKQYSLPGIKSKIQFLLLFLFPSPFLTFLKNGMQKR